MTGLPTVQVLLDDGTGTFPFDITSKVLIGPGVSFSRGRQDWQGGVTSGAVSLTLNNADGRFTPGSTVLASPSPIKVDQRIRVKETVNGTTYTRFTGYVKSWPVGWPATVSTWSTVQLVATDAQARAERRVLRSVIEQEILADAPVAHYMLGEPANSTSAADSSGNQAPLLTMAGSGAAVVFGTATGPTTDGLTAATFAGGQCLSATLSATPGAVECYFATTTNDATPRAILTVAGLVGPSLQNGNLGSAGSGSAGFVADGLIHHVLWAGASIYLDGVLTGLTGNAMSAVRPTLIVGGSTGVQGEPLPFIGSIAHVAAHSSAPSSARITAHYQAGTTGFAGEPGSTRINRLAGYAILPLGTLDTSLTNVPFVDFTGRSAWETIQQVADAEMGVVFFDGSGNLTFHNRNRPAAKTAPDLTLSSAYITPDVQPVTDDQQILNYIEGTSVGTGLTQVVRSTASEASHGRYPMSVEYLVQSDQEVLDRADWIIADFAESTTRYGTLAINLYAMTAAQAAAVLAAIEIDAWLRVVAMPSQNTTGATADVVVEGYAEEITASSWKLTCNVVSKALTDCLILDDSTRGVLDAGNRLYV